MSRSTMDLIAELELEAAEHNFSMLGVAVGFEERTEFVFSCDDDRLEKLNELVRNGGEPIGLVGFRESDLSGTAAFYCRPLAECANEEWVGGYLEALIEPMRRALHQMGIAILLVPQAG